MFSERTIGNLLDILIAAEEGSQKFHLQLARMFAHQPEARAVWWMMAADEEFIRSQLREHLLRLNQLRTPAWRRTVEARPLA